MRVATLIGASWRHLPLTFVLLLLGTVVLLLASTYFGQASSPYDMCTAPDGRSLPCSLVHEMGR